MGYQIVNAGEGGRLSGTLYDVNGDPIQKVDVADFRLTFRDAESGAIVNGRDNQSVLDANGGAMDATTGGFVWDYGSADTETLSALSELEEHEAQFRCVGSFAGGVLEFAHRIRCSNSLLLVRFDEMRMQLKDVDEDEEAYLTLLILAATRRLEEETDRVLRKSTEASPTVQVYSVGENQWSVDVRAFPVDSIVSVKEAIDGDFNDAVDIKADCFMATPYSVRHRFRPFMEGAGALEIRLAGGLARSTGGVPAHVQQAVMEQVAWWWKRRGSIGVSSQSLPDGSVTYFQKGPVLDGFQSIINLMKRKTLRV